MLDYNLSIRRAESKQKQLKSTKRKRGEETLAHLRDKKEHKKVAKVFISRRYIPQAVKAVSEGGQALPQTLQ